MHNYTVTSGYLIEKTFGRMYREYVDWLTRRRPDRLNKRGYAWPYAGICPDQMAKQYRGLQREPMQDWGACLFDSGPVEPTQQEFAASVFLAELESAGRFDDDFAVSLEDAVEVLRKIPAPVEREIIWARRMDARDNPPPGTVLLGYEPSQFYPPECISPIAEWMFYSDSAELDPEGTVFRFYFDKLNQWGLFDTQADAHEYLDAYLAFVPTDSDAHLYQHYIVEVRSVGRGK